MEQLKEQYLSRVKNDFGFHAATEVTRPKHERIRQMGLELAKFYIETCPVSRELSLALSSLQEAQMWANAAVACNEAPLEGV